MLVEEGKLNEVARLRVLRPMIKIEKGNYTFMKEYLPEIRENVNELERIQKLNESQAKQILSLENIKDIPKMMNFWTGLPNYETFNALYQGCF